MKRKFLKIIFSILTVVVVLVSFSLNIFALDQPSLFGLGVSDGNEYILTGNTDVLLSFGTRYYNSGSFTVGTSLNPTISTKMESNPDTYSYSTESLELDYLFSCVCDLQFSEWECTPNYCISGIVSDNSWFDSRFALSLSSSEGDEYSFYYLDVSARDFYIYLDPNGDIVDDEYGDQPFAESFIYLDTQSYFDYDAAEGSIYYCLAGEENDANNRQVYNYSLSSDAASDISFSTLPVDQSFSGTYSEPTLIYVEYFVLHIPFLEVQNTLDGFFLSGNYVNYNMDYRNLDISSGVDPVSPMNPGIFRDYTGWLGTAVGGFLDLQLVDGFTLGGILMVLIAFMIALWFLKVFAGG